MGNVTTITSNTLYEWCTEFLNGEQQVNDKTYIRVFYAAIKYLSLSAGVSSKQATYYAYEIFNQVCTNSFSKDLVKKAFLLFVQSFVGNEDFYNQVYYILQSNDDDFIVARMTVLFDKYHSDYVANTHFSWQELCSYLKQLLFKATEKECMDSKINVMEVFRNNKQFVDFIAFRTPMQIFVKTTKGSYYKLELTENVRLCLFYLYVYKKVAGTGSFIKALQSIKNNLSDSIVTHIQYASSIDNMQTSRYFCETVRGYLFNYVLKV